MLKIEPIYEYLLRKQDKSTVERNQMWYEQLTPFFQDMLEVPYAVLKGDVLSIFAYGGSGFRNSHDIDILVSRKDLTKLHEICDKHDFKQIVLDDNGNPRPLSRQEKIMFKNSHQVVPYFKKLENGTTIELDINCDFFWAEFKGTRIKVDKILEEAIDFNLHDCHVRVLTPLTAFVQMCLHHYREMNSIYIYKLKNPITVAMFQDIYMFYKNHYKFNITQLLDYTKEHRIEPYMYYLLFYSNLIFEDEALSEHVELFRTPEGEYLLNCYGLTETERKKWKCDFINRLNRIDLFELVENDLNEDDKKKIELSLSIK
ncbi:nucleotidyltransferase family protein [Paenibacillus agilis]|uniref:nucleotidyltransferase family protein n=1 Tax=Paenibacillus agilis TaxID=3020863 RepID=UPI001649F277|nr:nucleotidyltransferase family protein [Paenibacillus agilis]